MNPDYTNYKKMSLNELRASTIKWFNDTFGTALEDVPEGDTGQGRSCVLANALTNQVNANINWNVGNYNIRIGYDTYTNHIYDSYNAKYTIIPVTLGNECMSIDTHKWHSAPTNEDFSVESHQEVPIDLPNYVKAFINAFDYQAYPDLKSHNKEIDWYTGNTPKDMNIHIHPELVFDYKENKSIQEEGIEIIGIPTFSHNPSDCPRKDDYNDYPDFLPARGFGEGTCMYCDDECP